MGNWCGWSVFIMWMCWWIRCRCGRFWNGCWWIRCNNYRWMWSIWQRKLGRWRWWIWIKFRIDFLFRAVTVKIKKNYFSLFFNYFLVLTVLVALVVVQVVHIHHAALHIHYVEHDQKMERHIRHEFAVFCRNLNH